MVPGVEQNRQIMLDSRANQASPLVNYLDNIPLEYIPFISLGIPLAVDKDLPIFIVHLRHIRPEVVAWPSRLLAEQN